MNQNFAFAQAPSDTPTRAALFLSLGRCDALSDVMCQYGIRKQSLFQALPAVSDTVQLCVSET